MEALLTVTRDRRARPRGQIYALLRDAIVSAELAPGRQLSENELATLLGVSRTPIREALQRLRDDRLVEIVPQLGTFVTRISEDAVADAQFVREALECAAVRQTALRVRDQDLAGLEAIIRRQEASREANDFDAFYVLDDELHHALCDLSGHTIAWSLSQRAKGHLNRVRRAVVAAVAERDPDQAEHALRHHLRMVLSTLPAIRAQHPDYFESEEESA